MQQITCISSSLMSSLANARNQDGDETDWLYLPSHLQEDTSFKRKIKLIGAEIGMALLILTAAIETLAYTLLFVTAYSSSREFFADKLRSSIFTMAWCSKSLYDNLFKANIASMEWNARLDLGFSLNSEEICDSLVWHFELMQNRRAQIQPLNPYSQDISDSIELITAYIFSMIDYSNQNGILFVNTYTVRQINRFIRNYSIGNVFNDNFGNGVIDDFNTNTFFEDHIPQSRISNEEKGAQFLKDCILPTLNQKAISMIQESDPAIYLFVVTKSIYNYVLGQNKKKSIPEFFQAGTTTDIANLRKKLSSLSEKARTELENLLSDPIKFEKGPEIKPEEAPEITSNKEDAKAAFNSIRVVASREIQGGMFSTKCLFKAIQEFFK